MLGLPSWVKQLKIYTCKNYILIELEDNNIKWSLSEPNKCEEKNNKEGEVGKG